MNGLGVGHFGGRNDRGHVEIAQRGGRGANAHRFIGHLDVFGIAVCLGIHHDSLDAELAAGPLDAQGDLAAIGDQYFFKHASKYLVWPVGETQGSGPAYSMMKSGCPYSTAWPFSVSNRVTVPDLSASISLRIFIASMMQMVSPSLITLPTSTNGVASGLDAR